MSRAKPPAPAPQGPPPDTRRVFIVLVAVALVVRLLYFAQASAVPIFDHLMMDGAVYDAWAERIAGGEWLGGEVFYQAPLYPYLLALLKLCGAHGMWPIRLLQAVLGSLSCGLLFLAGQSFFSRRVGLFAGALLALYPPAIFFDGIVQKASIGGFFVVALLWCLARAKDAPSPARFGACGVALGLLMLTREETLLLAPVILIWIAAHFRSRAWPMRASWSCACAAGVALVVLPVALRNLRVGGEFVLTTSQAGSNFYIGNHAGAQGLYEPLRPGRSNPTFERADAFELAQIGAGRALTAREVSDYWFTQSFAWIREHPGDWARLLLRKASLLVNAFEIPDSEDQNYYARFSAMLAASSFVIHFGVVLPLAVAGIWLTWNRRRELAILLALLATLGVGVIAFYVFARYRYPVVPIAVLFAAAALDAALELWRAGEARKLRGAAIALALAAVISNWRILSRDSQLSMAYSNAGATLADDGRDDLAIEQYRTALALDPDMPDTQCNLGEVLGRNGRVAEAVDCFRRALAGRPDDARFAKDLGTALFENGDARGAVDALRRSTELEPRDPRVWNNLRYVHEQLGEWPSAVAVARGAVAANPGDLDSAVSLAWLLATAPDASLRNAGEAIRIAEDCERTAHPNDAGVQDVLAAAYALAGRFEEARAKALVAADIAEQTGEKQAAIEIRARAELYARREPFVQSAPTSAGR
jgi:Flp pilus assembly protein TadD/4-amino-4-deoxy-L-arabinose transferase-like glycosyltransferase